MNMEPNAEQILDQAIDEIRAEEMDQVTIEHAAGRVWANVSREAFVLRTCADFQALLPAYRAKQLPDAQLWLLEDHLHSCTACQRARLGKAPERAPRAAAHWTFTPEWRWAMAAALTIGIGIGAWQMRDDLLPAPGGPRGTVENVQGSLYRVSATGSTPIVTGAVLSEREEILTARGSNAMVRLEDGSLIEMRERSGLALSSKRSGTTIRLDRGSVIVQAAKQHTGRLYVATKDCLVSVKGTVFTVDSGAKGSRVSVLQGEVHVQEANETKILHPGEQVATAAAMSPLPIAQEIAWSRNASEHLSLLGEFAAMQKQLEQTPGPGLRYSSRLLDLVPDGAVLYVAIPNVGGILGDAQQIFQERLNQSQVLRDWWNSQQNPQKLAQALDTVREFSKYLGSEVVFTVSKDASGQYKAPVVMAQVTQSGFKPYLEQQVGQLAGGGHLTVAEDPSGLPSGPVQNGAMALLMNDVVAVSPDPANLRAVAGLIQQPGSGTFARTAFHERIAKAYQAGAGWLISVDMEQILPASVSDKERPAQRSQNAMLSRLGVYDVQHLLVERREVGGKTENRAVMTFSKARHGVAAWLASPAPMGALNFVSPDASFAVSFVVMQPKAAVQELFSALQAVDPNFASAESQFESQTGISVVDDLAAPLGGDVAFAIDGPVLPTPSWKFAIEVYDAAHLERTIETLVAKANSQAAAADLNLTQAQVGGRTYYTLQSAKSPVTVNYAYVDGYLVAAASQALLTQAISQQAAGITLAGSATFKSLLAPDGYSNFSAILYQNLGPVLNSLAGGLSAVAPGQQKLIAALQANAAPSLIYAYGEPEQIELASTGSFFGFNLDSLAGGGGPFQVPGVLEKVLRQHATQ
jgi:ferric-dicitrate binding protein FerR (iron transport regulator)